MDETLSEREARTLKALRQCGGPAFPAEIARAARATHSLADVMAALEILEDKGHVSAHPDGSRVAFEITRSGLAALVRASAGAQAASMPSGMRPA